MILPTCEREIAIRKVFFYWLFVTSLQEAGFFCFSFLFTRRCVSLVQGLVTPTWEDLSPRDPGFSILRRLGRLGGGRRGSREAAPLAGRSLLFSNPCLRTSGPPGAPSHRLRLRRAKSMCVTQAQGLRTQGRPSLKCSHSAVCRRGIGFKVPGCGATDSKVPFGVLPGVKYSGLPLPFFLSTSQHRSRKHPCWEPPPWPSASSLLP